MDRARLAAMLLGRSPMPQMSLPEQPLSMFQFPQYTGLRNSMDEGMPPVGLPPMPMQGLDQYQPPIPTPSPQGNYGPAWTPPGVSPASPEPAAPLPVTQPQTGSMGWGGPEPAPGSVPAPYNAMTDPRYLPEQWRGAFNPRWQG